MNEPFNLEEALNGTSKILTETLDKAKDLFDASSSSCCNSHLSEQQELVLDTLKSESNALIGMHPLHLSAMHGLIEICKVFIKNRLDLNLTNKIGKTALHLATMNNHVNITELLLIHGACVDKLDMLQMTPLHWACQRGYLDCMKILLKYNASLATRNKFGKSPFDLALEVGFQDLIDFISSWNKNSRKSILECKTNEKPNSLKINDWQQKDNNSEIEDNEEPFSEKSCHNQSFNMEEMCVSIGSMEDISENHQNFKNNFVESDENSRSSTDERQNQLLESLSSVVPEIASISEDKIDQCLDACADLLLAQTSLGGLDSSCDMFARAVEQGCTIQLTEAGRKVLNSITREPILLAQEEKDKRKRTKNSQIEDERKRTKNSQIDFNSCKQVAVFTRQQLSPKSLLSHSKSINQENLINTKTLDDDNLFHSQQFSSTSLNSEYSHKKLNLSSPKLSTSSGPPVKRHRI